VDEKMTESWLGREARKGGKEKIWEKEELK